MMCLMARLALFCLLLFVLGCGGGGGSEPYETRMAVTVRWSAFNADINRVILHLEERPNGTPMHLELLRQSSDPVVQLPVYAGRIYDLSYTAYSEDGSDNGGEHHAGGHQVTEQGATADVP
jgi:hypothetical protein